MNSLTAFFDWLLAASLRASLLALVVLLLQAALRRHLTARMRYALWLPVLTVLLMPVFPQSRWSVETVFAKPPQPVQITPAPIDFSPSTIPFDDRPSSPAPKPFDWPRIFSMVWLIGALGILLFGSASFLVTLRRFNRSRHLVSDELTSTIVQIAGEIGLRRVPRIWIASTIHSPAVTGFLRPTLLLPAQFDRAFSPAEARLVLKHELMHLKRHDLPLNAVLCVLMALHWFNPLLWLAFFKARLDREAACDAQVLQNDSADRRREYGHALLKVETAFCPRGLSLGFVGIFQRGAALRSRIRSIATHRQPHPIMKTTLVLTVILLGFFGITTAAPPDEDAPQVHIVARFVEFPESTITLPPPLDASTKAPGVLGALTDTQLQSLLKQMSSTKGVDLLYAPSVTTKSGQEGRIEVSREFAYKNERGQDATKKVGVMLSLLPTISGDNQIDLSLSPQIVELEGMTKTPGGTEQPVFSDRKTKQSVVMTAGQTVVLEMPAKTDTQIVIDESLFKTTRTRVVTVKRTILLATASLIDKKGKPVSSTKSLQDKLKSIILPSVQFRNAKIGDCIDYFRAVSKKLDTSTADPAQRGVNILLRAGDTTDSAAINLDLKNVPLIEALQETAEVANLQMTIQPYAVIIAPETSQTPDKLEITADETSLDEKTGILTAKGNAKTEVGKTTIQAGELVYDQKGLQLKVRAPFTITSDGAKRHVSTSPETTAVFDLKTGKLTTLGACKTQILTPHGSNIILPAVEFRNATLAEAIEFIRVKSRDLDPGKTGVNILLKGDGGAAKITLSLKNVPVSEALRYCADLAKHKLTSDAQSIFLTPVSEEASKKDDQAASPAAPPPPSAAAAQAAALRNAPKQRYEFTKAKLGDVLRFLATDAGINLFALADDNPVNQRLTTFSTQSSPFEALETLCRANGLELLLDQDRWFIRAADNPEQSGKSYVLPRTQDSIETILKDIRSILGGGETKPVAGKPQPSVQFKKEQNSVYVKATRLQHTWVSAYLQGLSSSAQSRETK